MPPQKYGPCCYRAIDSSDPLMPSISLNGRHKNLRKTPLPADVINLLKCPPLPNYKTIISAMDKRDSDSADDANDYLETELDNEED